ncbi:MAG: hypothetical protein EOP06_07615 [Proteobacteria bacterium]|nr:MAG: hypothetical protein EOP06_07615 [Pseudomonadota bacterium]
MKKMILAAVAAVFLSPHVYAESKGGGGGDGVRTGSNTWKLLDLAEMSFFQPLSSEDMKRQFNVMTSRLVYSCEAVAYANGDTPRNPFSSQLRIAEIFEWLSSGSFDGFVDFKWISKEYIYKNVGTPLTWYLTQKPLEEIADEGAVRLVDGVTKKQVAIQKAGVVIVYEPIFKKFDDESRAALVAHETLLRFVLLHNASTYKAYGTQKIRDMVKLAYSDTQKNFSSSDFPPNLWETYCGQNGVVLRNVHMAKFPSDTVPSK